MRRIKFIIISLAFLSSCTYTDWDRIHPNEYSYMGGSEWERAGFTYKDAKSWYDIGVKNPENAKMWIDNGFTPTEADKFINCKSKNFYGYNETKKFCNCSIEEAKNLKNTGLSLETLNNWISEIGCSETIKWIEKRFDLGEVLEYKRQNISVEEAVKWNTLPIPLESKLRCITNKYTVEDINNLMKNHNISSTTLSEICHYINQNDNEEWGKNGFTIRERLLWIKEGFSCEKAVEWRKHGFKLEEAKKFERIGVKNAILVKKNCPKGYEDFTKLFFTNPYDTKNRCFEFYGKSFQILSRTSALFMVEYKIFYLDSGNNSIPFIFQGIVKGEGVFEYVTSLGMHNTVPKLKEVCRFQ